MSNTEKTGGLRSRVLKAGSWIIGGYGISQLLRFSGNLVLTRLLFPEAFGLMAIVQAVILGIAMLSDIGLAPCIVQNKRGCDRRFLDTAWSIQIIRGVMMWIVLLLIAAPLSSFYSQPLLAELVPVAGLAAFIAGFNSTKLATADRKLDASIVTMIDVGSYAVGLAITLALAWFERSVWSLVWGGLLGTSLKMIASHCLLPGLNNKLGWDPEATKIFLGFGQWIFLSSLVTYLAGEGNKLLIGALLTIDQLAFFTLASTMNLMVVQACQQIAGKVLFPSYSEVLRERPERFYCVLERARFAVIVPCWLVSAGFVFCGSDLMGFLYDERYEISGRYLEILGAGSLVGALSLSYAGVLLAQGRVATSAMLQGIQVVIQILSVLVGYKLNSSIGAIVGLAAANWLTYVVIASYFAKASLWHRRIDLPVLAMSILVTIFAAIR